MCGRFYFKSNKDKLSQQFGVENAVDTKTSYNVTPSSKCIVVRPNLDSKEFANLSWGLVPSWAKPDNKVKPINAKAETIREKPYFRNAYNKHRCIIPVSGFYEWQGSKGDKRPYAIYPLNDDYFGLAGVWGEERRFGNVYHYHNRGERGNEIRSSSYAGNSRYEKL